MAGLAIVFLSGFVFAIGLGVSGMTLPQKVLAFLDVAGEWDPSLILVMGGSATVYLLLHRSVLKRGSPVFDKRFHLPGGQDIDRRLIVGASLFGVGWGLVGFCPGPGITALVSGTPQPLVFFVSMTTGMFIFNTLDVTGAHEPGGGTSLLDRILGT